ncbi:peptidase inhibitor family I36 protein [Rhizobacter sp. Root1221]|uniref:peptidase inhibitor family I36 protein n=1 Tax=Rhizobacter sp. Root1221 TaxID=1736433 RepID=UPI000B1CF942|nr:peptidase inhibitor family I36 protein [Rhizobacter sp. Root1221]
MSRQALSPLASASPVHRLMLPLASLTVLLAACGGGGGNASASGDSAAALEATVEAAEAAADPVCYFEHANYQGKSFCGSADNNWLGNAWNDRISSVKVKAGYKLQLFQHIAYGGRSVTLTADSANLGGQGFNDTASSLKVVAPATPPVTPPVTASPVGGIQLAQSLLFNSDDSALVLVSGKAVLVKVNVTSSTAGAAKPSGTLRVENTVDGVTRDLLLATPTGNLPGTVPQVPSFTDAYTVTVPADLVKPGLRLTALIGSSPGTTITPRVGGGVPMKFIPISVQIAGTAGKLPANQGPHVQALFPVSAVTVQAHNTYVSGRVTTLPTSDAGWSDAFGKILGELADLHTLEGAARHDHYFGFIPKRTWGLAGLAYVGGNSGVGFDMPDSPKTVRDVVAHELGHNFSLPHAACGGAGNPDPKYPYPDANLGKPGRYVWPYLADTATFYDPRPTDRHDIMSYCGGEVFSDYNYRQMQTYLTPTDKMVMAAKAQAGPAQELLLISGEIGATGAELNPVKSLLGEARLPEAGPYTLRITTAAGVVDYPFAPRTLDHDTVLQHFGFTVPHPGAIQGLAVLRDGKVLVTTRATALRSTDPALSAAPQVQVQEASGTVKLVWDAVRHPYLTVTWTGGGQRRNLAQDLRGGNATLPADDLPAGGSFEFVLSDGLNPVRVTRAR